MPRINMGCRNFLCRRMRSSVVGSMLLDLRMCEYACRKCVNRHRPSETSPFDTDAKLGNFGGMGKKEPLPRKREQGLDVICHTATAICGERAAVAIDYWFTGVTSNSLGSGCGVLELEFTSTCGMRNRCGIVPPEIATKPSRFLVRRKSLNTSF